MFAADVGAAEFGTRGGPEPANIDEIANVLRQDPYDMELLISYGTSKGGSAGHLALAIRDQASDDDVVYSANFYADRAPEHANGFYTDDLMIRIPKKEYLFETRSSLGDTASFGLDFGEIYKRSVIGVRVYGVPAAEKEALAAFFQRINDDYHNRVRPPSTTTARYGTTTSASTAPRPSAPDSSTALGTETSRSRARSFSPGEGVAAANANIPTEMAMKLLKEWNARGYGLDVVMYKKYEGSTYVDPHEEDKVAFKDLPNRFPSVLSRDFRKEQGQYEDFDNLFAMYLLYNLAKYSVRVNDETKLLEIEKSKNPMAYPEAAELARRVPSRTANFLRRLPVPTDRDRDRGPDRRETQETVP